MRMSIHKFFKLGACPRFRRADILKIIVLAVLFVVLAISLYNNAIHVNDNGTIDDWILSYYEDMDVKTTMKVDPFYDELDVEKEENREEKKERGQLVAEKAKQEMLTSPKYQSRLSQANDYCLKRPSGFVLRVIFDTQKKTSMCVVPKVGCTHWINVFRFINNQTNGVVYDTPAEIPRWTTHFGELLQEVSVQQKIRNDRTYFKTNSFIGDTFRFMFVRHPIRRLWSAWVDKFLLPDFWFEEGPYVVDYLNLKRNACPTNITFNQFLRYVTHGHFVKWPNDANPHWKPMQYLCDPCVFRPHFIGKMESFSEDSDLVLSAMNIEPYLEERRKAKSNKTTAYSRLLLSRTKPGAIWSHTPYKKDRAVHEMTMLTEYNFELLNIKKFRNHLEECGIKELFIANRLWKAFQLNGYIRMDINFSLKQWDMDDWHKALLRAYISWPQDSRIRQEQQRAQKEKSLRSGFVRIPLTTLLKLKDLFWFDFSQYGYQFDPLWKN